MESKGDSLGFAAPHPKPSKQRLIFCSRGTSGITLISLWKTLQEKNRREKVLPILKTTLVQIDGSIKAKHATQQKVTKAQNMEEFGRMFYEVTTT